MRGARMIFIGLGIEWRFEGVVVVYYYFKVQLFEIYRSFSVRGRDGRVLVVCVYYIVV